MKEKIKRKLKKYFVVFIFLLLIGIFPFIYLEHIQDQEKDIPTPPRYPYYLETYHYNLWVQALNHCRGRCPSMCSDENLLTFCLSYGNDIYSDDQVIDLNIIKRSNQYGEHLEGISVCEDAIPCHVMMHSCCGRQLNQSFCYDLIKEQWTKQFGSEKETWPLELIKKGSCKEIREENHWFNLAGFNEW